MKRSKTIFWVATGILFLLEGLMPVLTSNSELAKAGIRHLGYPDYFRIMLVIFKILGALALVLPFVSRRIKEWAYAGFAFNFIAAAVSHWAVDGFSGQVFFPAAVLGILAVSYFQFHKIQCSAKPLVAALLLPLGLALTSFVQPTQQPEATQTCWILKSNPNLPDTATAP